MSDNKNQSKIKNTTFLLVSTSGLTFDLNTQRQFYTWLDVINNRFLTTETNSKALYIFCCLFTTSSVKLFVVNVQIFVYNCVFWKKEKQLSQKPFTF